MCRPYGTTVLLWALQGMDRLRNDMAEHRKIRIVLFFALLLINDPTCTSQDPLRVLQTAQTCQLSGLSPSYFLMFPIKFGHSSEVPKLKEPECSSKQCVSEQWWKVLYLHRVYSPKAISPIQTQGNRNSISATCRILTGVFCQFTSKVRDW